MKNVTLQPIVVSSETDRIGTIRAIIPADDNIIDIAPARFSLGKVSEIILEQEGWNPPSPIPNKKRIATIDANDQAAPVRPVNIDHKITDAIKTRLAPKRSASHPPGSCINA